jgi:MFS family permease
MRDHPPNSRNIPPSQLPPLRLSWFVWGLGALFYLMGFFHRVAPAVMTAELMREFKIGAAALGNLSGYYFYSYVAMQIPTGIVVDTWGPRRLLCAGALVAGMGMLLFALAPNLAWAGIGRLLIGGSVAVAFYGNIKTLILFCHCRMITKKFRYLIALPYFLFVVSTDRYV